MEADLGAHQGGNGSGDGGDPLARALREQRAERARRQRPRRSASCLARATSHPKLSSCNGRPRVPSRAKGSDYTEEGHSSQGSTSTSRQLGPCDMKSQQNVHPWAIALVCRGEREADHLQ
eukprot:2186460-Pleurochrysis_carterae.AAC.1